MRDHYAALGVQRDADFEEIKRAYRAQVKLHHPDAGAVTARKDDVSAADQAAMANVAG